MAAPAAEDQKKIYDADGNINRSRFHHVPGDTYGRYMFNVYGMCWDTISKRFLTVNRSSSLRVEIEDDDNPTLYGVITVLKALKLIFCHAEPSAIPEDSEYREPILSAITFRKLKELGKLVKFAPGYYLNVDTKEVWNASRMNIVVSFAKSSCGVAPEIRDLYKQKIRELKAKEPVEKEILAPQPKEELPVAPVTVESTPVVVEPQHEYVSVKQQITDVLAVVKDFCEKQEITDDITDDLLNNIKSRILCALSDSLSR